ncbi:antitoxin HicB [Candidatus Falkowbacteria bacterium CG10_big_fil_rev_8_21_14_0_10_43_11]|uniref:Antitoxin HicB n=1 Tax=Candidatus Falkowbacteria bacterium CG10_big_fil_rev_8_21_14_0_10_43_11 TaxID=1974568 RepID=A0A2M6WL33_9BACT|nr:MAG: antitoxin HicB [Candidatus Falkowbacteria bacterium CG10_big_fil_rev_8_21_14_0_10_43_11]
MKFYTFRTIIEPDGKGYHGFVPILPGVHTCGATVKDVQKNLKEAIACHVQGLVKDKERIPREEETVEIVQTFSEQELSLSY